MDYTNKTRELNRAMSELIAMYENFVDEVNESDLDDKTKEGIVKATRNTIDSTRFHMLMLSMQAELATSTTAFVMGRASALKEAEQILRKG